jgi:hypothetical protein
MRRVRSEEGVKTVGRAGENSVRGAWGERAGVRSRERPGPRIMQQGNGGHTKGEGGAMTTLEDKGERDETDKGS